MKAVARQPPAREVIPVLIPITSLFSSSLLVFVQKMGLATTLPSRKNLKQPLCVAVLAIFLKVSFFMASTHIAQTSSQQLQLLIWSRPCGLAKRVLVMLSVLARLFIQLTNSWVQNLTLSKSSVRSMLLISNQMHSGLHSTNVLLPVFSKQSTAPTFSERTVAASLPLGSRSPQSRSSIVIHAFSMRSAVVPEVEVAQLVTLKQVLFSDMLNFSQISSVQRAVITFVSEAISRLAFSLKPTITLLLPYWYYPMQQSHDLAVRRSRAAVEGF